MLTRAVYNEREIANHVHTSLFAITYTYIYIYVHIYTRRVDGGKGINIEILYVILRDYSRRVWIFTAARAASLVTKFSTNFVRYLLSDPVLFQLREAKKFSFIHGEIRLRISTGPLPVPGIKRARTDTHLTPRLDVALAVHSPFPGTNATILTILTRIAPHSRNPCARRA